MERYLIIGFIILILALLIFYIIRVYNKLIKGLNRVNTQWAQIDVQLTRRSDLIPNLVETVKDYASHEKEIFENVTAARNALKSAPSPTEAINANDQLSGQLLRLIAVAEAYPDLKANIGYIQLQSSLKDTEDKIAYARQFYNDTVLIYKDRIHQFPSNVIAKIFRFKDESFFIPAEDRKGDTKSNE